MAAFKYLGLLTILEYLSIYPKKLKIVSRSEWQAMPPNGHIVKHNLPVENIIIGHTETVNSLTRAQCSYDCRFLQLIQMEVVGFDDIAFNFLIGGDGAVYEGRGWNNQGAHTYGYNRNSLFFAFLGTFHDVAPPKQQLKAAKRLISEGVRLKKIHKNYRLYGRRQLIGPDNPGNPLFDIIKTWKNWSNNILDF